MSLSCKRSLFVVGLPNGSSSDRVIIRTITVKLSSNVIERYRMNPQ